MRVLQHAHQLRVRGHFARLLSLLNVVAIVQRVLILLSQETRHDRVHHSLSTPLACPSLDGRDKMCGPPFALYGGGDHLRLILCGVGQVANRGLDLVPYFVKSHPRPRISVRTIRNLSSVEKPTHTVDGSLESCCLGTTSKDHPSPSQDFHVGTLAAALREDLGLASTMSDGGLRPCSQSSNGYFHVLLNEHIQHSMLQCHVARECRFALLRCTCEVLPPPQLISEAVVMRVRGSHPLCYHAQPRAWPSSPALTFGSSLPIICMLVWANFKLTG